MSHFDEPRRHRRFMGVLGLTALLTSPFPFVGRETLWLWGLPAWWWWSAAFTAAFSGLTAFGVLRLWRDDRFE